MISIIASVFNESESLNHFYDALNDVLAKINQPAEIIFIDDGSTDNSADIISRIIEKDSRVRLIQLSRNFGHESAMLAGIDHSSGDAVIVMDSDLQHPPSLIPEMLSQYDKGFDAILMKRDKSNRKNIFSALFQHLFYKIFNTLSRIKLEENASDFFLISRGIADILRNDMRERTRFLRGLIQWCGFNMKALTFNVKDRAYGRSKYNLFRLLSLSLDAIFSFSTAPLTLIIYIGLALAGFAFLYLIYAVIMKFVGVSIEGWASLLALFSLLTGFHLVATGVIGKYIGIILMETKQRPLYIIKNKVNLKK